MTYKCKTMYIHGSHKQLSPILCVCVCVYLHVQTSHRHRGSNWDRNVLALTILLPLDTSQQRLRCLRSVGRFNPKSKTPSQYILDEHLKVSVNKILCAVLFCSCREHFLSVLTTSCWAAVPLKSYSATTTERTTLIGELQQLWLLQILTNYSLKSSASRSKHVVSMMIVLILTLHQLIIHVVFWNNTENLKLGSGGLVGLCVGILSRKIDFRGIIGHPNSCCNPSCNFIVGLFN